MPVIDVHTHMVSPAWLEMVRAHGRPRLDYRAEGDPGEIWLDGRPFMDLTPAMLDHDLRLADMDAAGVDLAIVSLTCPNVYFGDQGVSAGAARLSNDDMAAAQAQHPDRLRWLASLPWQHPDAALAELDRALAAGALGVMVLAQIAGEALTSERFAPIWRAIDERALPVLVHPGAPAPVSAGGPGDFGLAATVGFPAETTMAVADLIFSGFLTSHQRLRIIAAHGGGALPFLAGRLDAWWAAGHARERIDIPPSELLRRIHVDAITYHPGALALCVEAVGPDRVLFGSDYPHPTGDMAGTLGRVDDLPAGVRERVRGANAARLFRL